MADGGASGIILGLPGLVTACADLYKLTVAARNFDHDVNMVIYRMSWEQLKFACWLRDAGFVEGSQPTLRLDPAAQSALMMFLQGVKENLTLLAELLEKYELPHDADSKGRASLALPDSFWRLRLKDSTSRPASPSPFQRLVRGKGKLTWAAAQKERADELLGNLKELNECLAFVSGLSSSARASALPSRMLPHIWGDDNLRTFVEATAQHDPDLARCAEFKREAVASFATPPSATPGSPSPLELLPARITKRRPTQHSQLAVAELNNKKTKETWPVLLEDKSYVGGREAPSYASFVKDRVGEMATILAKSPKPSSLRVLDCAGYVPSLKTRSFSFVFHFPAGTATDTDPISLQRLLPTGSNGWAEHRRAAATSGQSLPPAAPGIDLHAKPSLRTRFAMALSLTQSLVLLQACGVLHKDLTPANILFFRNQQAAANSTGPSYDLSRPYICGFSWARLHGSRFISEPMGSQGAIASTSSRLQTHPGYTFDQQQRYLKVFDLYSLGLVLLQIGLWRDLPDVADKFFPSSKSSINSVGATLEAAVRGEQEEWLRGKLAEWQNELATRQHAVSQSDGLAAEKDPRRSFQKSLVENVEGLLLGEAGETYTRVVARCLTGDIDNTGIARAIVETTEDENEPEYILQDGIVRNIVEELGKCNV